MPRRNRNAWRNDQARADLQRERVVDDLATRRGRRKRRRLEQRSRAA